MPAIMNLRSALDGPDFYPTPAWAVEALCDLINIDGDVLEPCCGMGHMSETLKRRGLRVQSSDLHDRGYGDVGVDARAISGRHDNIITNPPFAIATDLLSPFIGAARKKVCLLLRMSFLESRRRYPLFEQAPPSEVLVFSERLSMAPHGKEVNGGGTISYAWFVWNIEGMGETKLRWIPPGYKRRGLE